jgi:hypothetical protein
VGLISTSDPGISGYACNIGKFSEDDCVLVEILYELGAVPFVRTNVPQTLMVSVMIHDPIVHTGRGA